jgi:aminopeptidase N
MRLNWLFCLLCLLAMSIFCVACNSGPGSTPSPSSKSAPTSNILPLSTSLPTSPDVLDACPVEEQSQAMRESQIPNWQHIGIFACYQLSLDLSVSSKIYPGVETLVFNNQTGVTLNEIVLRVFPNAKNIYNGKMTIQSVKMDQKDLPFEYFLADQTGLRIHLDSPLKPEDTAQLTLVFSIEIPLDFGSNLSYGIYNESSSGPEFNLANWFPILAVFKDGSWQADPVLMGGDAVTSQTALFKVTITAPESWQIASTGTQIQQIDEQGLSKHIYVSGPVRDFMIAASPAFEMRQTLVDDISIVQWGPADTQVSWDAALEDARTALSYYEKTFGSYPFNELDVVAVKLQNASGVEYPGLVLIYDSGYLNTQEQEYLKIVIAHEIAHQWWYSLVGNDVLRNPWQDEALATFSSWMFLEISSPGIDYIGHYQTQVNNYDHQNPGQSIEQPLEAFQGRDSQYGLVVYIKGALFFNAVRAQMGDAAFSQALAAYYQKYKYKLVYPADLLILFTQTCGCDLTAVEKEYGVQPVNP